MGGEDAVYCVGLIGGLIIGALVMRVLGFVGIVQFLGALVFGVGCGYLAEKTYTGGSGSGGDDFRGPD